MATGVDHAMAASPTGAVGKAKVGEPVHVPGTTGVVIKVAIFFDGTKNNRTNTAKRLSSPGILVGKSKDDESSYANFYSNVAIMELLNNRRDSGKHEVSVYVEGIGTNNFVEGATAKNKQGQTVRVADKDNGNDDSVGYAIGSGPTGIVSKVTKGLQQLREGIAAAYVPDEQFISKLIIDVAGFSRGAAAARHFVARRASLRTGWMHQGPPELEINFVGLYDTVSSYESLKGAGGEAAMYLASLRLVPGPFNIPVPLNPHMFSTDTMFGDDVLQLGLDLRDLPKKVVHLTAQDEYRENFSLTNINTSLKAHKGLEVSLPGAHSDIGGGYVEDDPHNPHRDLNKEVRRIHDAAEKRQLIRDGWYLPNQFEPWRQYHTPAIPSVPVAVPLPFPLPPLTMRTPGVKSYPIQIWENGVRYLTHHYQFVPLSIMLGFASRGGAHTPMSFDSLNGKFARYQVPGELTALRDHFDREARKLDGNIPPRKQGDVTLAALHCPSVEQAKWLRNKYLHRSARLFTELKIGMAGRTDAGRSNHFRLVIPDDVRVEKVQDTTRRAVKQTAASVHDRLNQLRSQADRALGALREGAKRGLEELGRNPPMMPPF